jgi:phosphoribosylanthranilate isomerase
VIQRPPCAPFIRLGAELVAVRIKICGIRSVDDARIAVAAGADAIGLILSPARRQVQVEVARTITSTLPPFVVPVGVFVDEPANRIAQFARELGLGAVQLHGDEPAEAAESLVSQGLRVIKAFRVSDRVDHAALARFRAASAILLDTRVEGVMGGTGRTFPWRIAEGLSSEYRVVLAGGLHPGNVADALTALAPYAVDVTSGVESGDRKDPVKVAAFVDAVRAWDARAAATREP